MMRRSLSLLLPLLVLSAVGCGKKEGVPVQKAPPVVQGATIGTVSAEALPETTEAVGTVKARSSATVSARLTGNVSGVFVREGDRVGRGKRLVDIEAAESSAAAAGAQSGAEEAQRGLEEARSRKRLADATHERYRRLFDEQAVTRQEYEERRMEKEVAAEGVARAQARLDQMRQQAKAAGTVAGYGRVSSPIAGVVVTKQVEPGQTVFAGTPLLVIESTDGYRLEVSAPESLLDKLRVGDRVPLALEGGPSSGRIAEILPTVDPVSRTFVVKLDLPSVRLRSGLYGKALFRVGSRQGVAVPARAVVERGPLTSVWVVSPEGMARLRLVKLGKTVGDRVEVLSGLTAGESIVIDGADRVVDGAKVR